MSVSLEIQGVKSNDALAKEAQMEDEVQNAGQEGDLVVPLPVETVQQSRDVKQTETPEKEVAKAENATKETQSTIRDAEPKQAKVRQQRKRKVVEPTPPAGTPSIDYLKQMQERFDKLEGMLNEYKDIQLRRASETPMQAYGVPSGSTKRRAVEMPRYSNEYEEYDPREHLDKVPLHNNYHPQEFERSRAPPQPPNMDLHQAELYRRRTKDALDKVIYDSESTMRNRKENSVTQTATGEGRGHWYSQW